MIPPILIFIAGLCIFLYLYHFISQNRSSELNRLELQRKKLQDKYEFLRNHRKEVATELEQKKNELQTLRNSQDGIRTISSDDLDIQDVDENEKISRFLLQEGKITLEQNEKVLKKMDLLQMDYLGVCMALGIIDLATAKRTMKINKIKSKTISAN